MKKGIDVSKWQGNIDWEKVKKAGVEFAIIRVGYGNNNIDEQFTRNIAECNRLGIPCGVYWFSYALNEEMARQEARYCLEAIKPYRVEYPICFDFEYDSVRYARGKGVIIDKGLATALVEAFCDEVEKTGYYAMNYSNKDYMRNMFDMDRLRKYDLWYAYWSSTCDRDDAGIWQYTSDGKVDGINGRVDMNIAFKDYPAIIKKAGLNGLGKDVLQQKPGLPPLRSEPEREKNKEVVYTVKKGNTLSKIAQIFNTTVSKLVQRNKIKNPNLIYPGQKIKIAGNESKSREIVYVVQNGDTLSEIAQRYNTTVEKLAEDNGIKNKNLIYPGQRIKIK